MMTVDEEVRKHVADSLRSSRKKAGFKSAREFAESIGMPPARYAEYEQGRRSIPLSVACELADALHCSLDELAGRSFKARGERPTDPLSSELFDLFPQLTTDRKRRLVETARDGAAMSKDDAERGVGMAEGVA